VVKRALLCAVAACTPSLDDRVSLVAEPRILAVRAEPAEAAPGAVMSLTALVVDGSGAPVAAALRFGLCADRNPLAELAPFSAACRSGASAIEVGASFTLPSDVCRRFGPEVGTEGRPVDPDVTGGYYQPVRVLASVAGVDVVAVDRARIACGAAQVSTETLAAYRARYRANVNPDVQVEAPRRARPGERITVAARFSICSAPCRGREPYVAVDPRTGALVERTEVMTVSWFAAAGVFDVDRASPGGDVAENAWTAPTSAGVVPLYAVLRDDRGGSGWAQIAIDVRAD